jgi:hypothetical protein
MQTDVETGEQVLCNTDLKSGDLLAYIHKDWSGARTNGGEPIVSIQFGRVMQNLGQDPTYPGTDLLRIRYIAVDAEVGQNWDVDSSKNYTKVPT